MVDFKQAGNNAETAAATDAKVKYIRTRAQDDDFNTQLLIGYLQ